MRKLLVLSMSLTLGLTALVAAPVAAGDYLCGDETIIGGTITGDVTVLAGKECQLVGVTIEGNVVAEKGAELAGVYQGSLVKGDVQGGKGSQVDVYSSTVEGNVQVDKADRVYVENATVEGDVRATKVRYLAHIIDSDIYGNLQFEKCGRKEYLGVIFFPPEVYRNTVGGDCQGEKNKEPVESYGNVVTGNIEGQCQGVHP